MPRLIWSPRAIQDIERLRSFILKHDPGAAARAVKAIRQGVRHLVGNPHIGRQAEDMPPNVRDWLIAFGSSYYIARYEYSAGTIVIIAVRHAREAGF